MGAAFTHRQQTTRPGSTRGGVGASNSGLMARKLPGRMVRTLG